MSELKDTFEKFLADNEAWDMFITGPAGTGKTTSLDELVEFAKAQGLNPVVCAFTHKACNILRSKLSADTNIATLHSVLRKRPTVNDQATKAKYIEKSMQHTKPDKYDILFIDEFSMVGEQDYMDIVALQDPEYEGAPAMKVVYIGDLNQLPPVGDMQTINPSGEYWVKLTKIYRQKDGNELLDTLHSIVDMLGGAAPTPLTPNKNFIRDINLEQEYRNCKDEDKVLLAYTNQRVEKLNRWIAGKEEPNHNDSLFSPTTRMHYIMDHFIPSSFINTIRKAYGDEELGFGSKYKTLEYLLTMPGIKFIDMHTDDGEGEFVTYACIFGHYQYKLYLDDLKRAAAQANKEIERVHKASAKIWAHANPHAPLARARAKAWRDYLTFKECVICLDFPHALTVHKSQGSTYKYVFLDTEDLYRCAETNFTLYLKLLYVGIGRASEKVYTN